MSFIHLLQWWYGRGWGLQWRLAGKRTGRIADAFSEGTLIRTLFAPWKRIVADTNGGGFNVIIQGMIDNLVSRLVGFTVRITVLIGATVAIIIVGLGSVLAALVWPLVPLLGLLCIVFAMGAL